jgi:hypothetical protein
MQNFYFSIHYEKFFEFEDVYSARSYPLTETNKANLQIDQFFMLVRQYVFK